MSRSRTVQRFARKVCSGLARKGTRDEGHHSEAVLAGQCLVTGSSGGIGLALARGLAEAGARVVVNGRDSGKVAAAVASMKSDGLLADAAVFDVTDPERVERGVASIE